MLSLFQINSADTISDICYEKNKRYLILCNFDGYIHVYATNTNEDAQLFIGTDNNQLQVRSFDGDAIKSLLDGTQPVSALYLNESCLFVGTIDCKVMMLNLNDDSNQIINFDGHNGPILCLNVHYENKWLATSSCDGFVRIYDINQKLLIKKLNLIEKTNDIKNSSWLGKIEWDIIEESLLVPIKNSIFFYQTNGWNRRRKEYKNNTNQTHVDFVKYSPCQKFLVVVHRDQQLVIVDRLTLNIFGSYSTKAMVSSLCWNPGEKNILTYATITGDIVHLQLMSSFPEGEQLMSFNNLARINNQHIKNKLDYLLIYLLWYSMTNKVYLLINEEKTIDYYMNNQENVGYIFKKMLKDSDLRIKIFRSEHKLIIFSESKTPSFTSTIDIQYEYYVHERDGKFRLKHVSELKPELKRKMERLFDFIHQQEQIGQAGNQQVQIVDEQCISVHHKKFSETYMMKNLLKK